MRIHVIMNLFMMTLRKQGRNLSLIVFLLLIGAATYWLRQEDINHNGRLYPSKQKMCMEFAQSYLKTIKKTESITDFSGNAWNRAIAIESDLYKLCLSDLTDESLEELELNNIRRYLDVYRNQ